MAMLFWQLNTDRVGLQDHAGAFFFISINQMFGGLFGSLLLFHQERAVFLREFANKSYGVIPYFSAKSIVELPIALLFPILTAVIIYWPIGLANDFVKFILFTAILCLISLCSNSLGLFLGCTFTSVETANDLAPLVM